MKKRSKSGVEVVATVEEELYTNVRSYIIEGRAKAYVAANTALVETYWKVGKEIVEKQGGAAKSAYGDHLVDGLARRLTIEFGRGYTRVNLFYMRRFYLAFPKVHTLCEQLSWSHYRELITVENEDARRFYAEECVKCRWGVRDLQRQIHTEFYERLLHNKIKPDAVSSLVKKGSEDYNILTFIPSPPGPVCLTKSANMLAPTTPTRSRMGCGRQCEKQVRDRLADLPGDCGPEP